MAERDSQRAKLYKTMMTKIKASQERMVKYHQRRNSAKGQEFKVGDQVLLRNKKRDDRKGGKMETTWSKDVYEVIAVRGRSTYKLKNIVSSIYLQKTVNGVHLKKYVS